MSPSNDSDITMTQNNSEPDQVKKTAKKKKIPPLKSMLKGGN